MYNIKIMTFMVVIYQAKIMDVVIKTITKMVVYMKKRRGFVFLGVAIGVLISMSTAGCASLSEKETEAKKEASVPVIRPEENGRDLVEAFLRNRPKAFVAALPEDLRKQFGEAEFEGAYKSIVETLGKPVSYKFAFQIENPFVTVSVWAVRFERKSEEGKILHQEALFRVISGVIDKQPKIISFNFL